MAQRLRSGQIFRYFRSENFAVKKLGLKTNLGVRRIRGQYFMGSKFLDVKIFVRSTFFGGPKFGRSNILGVLTF